MLNKDVKISDVKEQIGALVRLFRKNEKLTQQDLADKLDVSRITIQNLESGKNFTIDTLLKVVQYFDLLNELNQGIKDKKSMLESIKPLY